MKIGSKDIGPGHPCFVIGEVGLAHDGSLRIAHEFIDAIADAGADAVKFQCHLGDPVDEWRIYPKWGFERRENYWKRTDFIYSNWLELKDHATKRGPIFLCSPFSVEAVKLLDPLVPAWKIPSGLIVDDELLNAVKATGKPILLSTGMAASDEIKAAYLKFEDCVLMQCTSLYPCPPEKVDLTWRLERAGSGVYKGLSDHSGTIYAGLAAVALGYNVLEVHVKLSEYDQGPDASSSITIPKLKELVEGVRFIEKAKQPIDKDQMAKELEGMRRIFMRQEVV